MDITRISPDSSAYPSVLRTAFADRPLPPLTAIGNLALLQARLLALFCSVRCPGDVILKAYDLIRGIRDAGIPMIGGFDSPMEKECLELLLRGPQPVVVCPARGIEGMRHPVHFKKPLVEHRLLILSPFASKHRRVTAEFSETRNRVVAAFAEQVIVPHAEIDSRTAGLCQVLIAGGKSVWTAESGSNDHLLHMGAKPLRIDNLRLLRLSAVVGPMVGNPDQGT